MNYDLFNRFSESVKKHADDIACQLKENDTYITYTYSQLYDITLKIAAFLSEEGLTKQERIAILLENSHLWPAIYFGITAIGATAVPIDTKLTPYEITNLIHNSQAKILFTSEELYSPLKNSLKNILSLKKTVLSLAEIDQIKPSLKISSNNNPDDTASLLYTSGTTALPKGVILTHKNICSNFDSILKLKLVGPKDNVISLLPLHHSYPFMVTIIVPLFSGAKITFLNSLKSDDLLKCVRQNKVTLLVGVPQLFYFLHKAIFEKIKNAPLILSLLKLTYVSGKLLHLNLNKIILKKLHQNFGDSLRFFISGGARLEPKIAYELTLLGFRILEGYGLTETSPVVTFNPPRRPKIGSVGLPIPGVKVRINNPDNDGIGEVLIQGPNVMKGYYKREKETEAVLKDGWFYSGDLGFIDKKGYLYLTGRSKEIIVLSSGKNIYPEEIEAHYLKSPYIKEICVLDSAVGGLESLYAVILPNVDYFRKTKEVNIRGKIRWLLENLSKELPSYKRIMGFTIAKEELPKTRLGKLKRYEIKAKYLTAQDSSKIDTEPKKENESLGLYKAAENIEEAELKYTDEILKFLSEELKLKVSINDHLELDLGVDSLSRVELAIGLEKKFNIAIPDSDLSDVFTVKELIIKINQLLKQKQNQAPSSLSEVSWSKIIHENPPDEILSKINLKPGILDTTLTFIIVNLMYFIFKFFWSLKIEGKENLPKNKSFIICPNHTSFLDGFIIASSVGIKTEANLFFLGYSGYFKHPIVRWATKLARLIAIDPTANLTYAMQAAHFILKNNKALCIFPEGERSIDGQLKTFKKGVGILINEIDCLVVPCYIKGSCRAWPRGQKFPKISPLKVTFGRPCAKDELKNAGKKFSLPDDYETIAAGLKEKVKELS